MSKPGRDSRVAMERVLRLLLTLHERRERWAEAHELIAVAGYGERDAGSQLSRDLRQLREQGWRIDRLSGDGESARYRLAGGDNRLRLRLTPQQQAALQRAALLADRADLVRRLGLEQAADSAVRPGPVQSALEVAGQGEALTTALDAVGGARLLRFAYKGRARVLHPGSVRHQNRQWYLSGIEDDDPDERLKHFVLGRMSGVTAGPIGTARAVPEARLTLHPLAWLVDDPTEVVLRAPARFVPDVRRWLREPDSILERAETVELTYTVTNRAALRSRIYALGRRVEVLAPSEVREELLAELRELAGV